MHAYTNKFTASLTALLYIGLFQLPVTNLVQPQSETRLIRKLDTTFVKNLKKSIEDNPSGPGQWRSEGVFLVFWKTPLKMSLKNLLKIIYVTI